MTVMPERHGGLFAAKGRALPACSEPLVERTSTPATSPTTIQTTQTPPRSATKSPSPTPGKARNGLPGNGPADGPADEQPGEEPDGQPDRPASVLSIDLRRAFVPAPPPIPAPAAAPPPATPAPAPPGPALASPSAPRPSFGQTAAGPLVAALVAIVTAAGVFVFLNGDRLGDYSETQAPAAASEATDAAPEQGAGAAGAQTATSPAAETTPETASDDRAQTGGDSQGGPAPSFDLVRMEPDGSAVIAGRAAPYAELVLLHNGEPIGTVTADWAGEWAFVTDRPLVADEHAISLLVNEPDAEITLPQGGDAPAPVGATEKAAAPQD